MLVAAYSTVRQILPRPIQQVAAPNLRRSRGFPQLLSRCGILGLSRSPQNDLRTECRRCFGTCGKVRDQYSGSCFVFVSKSQARHDTGDASLVVPDPRWICCQKPPTPVTVAAISIWRTALNSCLKPLMSFYLILTRSLRSLNLWSCA